MLNDIDSRRLFCVDELLKQESNERGKEFTMKKISALFMVLILTQGLCACTATQPEEHGAEASQGPTWQEQYDLGVRYLSEGNYEEAILAFSVAIEIDPKQAPAYVGRGDAYVLSGETEDNLEAARLDYELAIDLDDTDVDAYLGLAEIYMRNGDYEKALQVLRRGARRAGEDTRLTERMTTVEEEINENIVDIILNHEPLWNRPFMPENEAEYGLFFEGESYSLCFIDLDFDGVRELVIESPIMGSGMYTNRYIYQIRGQELVEIEEAYGLSTGWDKISLMRNKLTKDYFYVGYDCVKEGAFWYSETWEQFQVQQGKIESSLLYMRKQEEDITTHYGPDGKVISQAEFERLQEELFETVDEIEDFRGIVLQGWEVGASREEKRELLLEVYCSAPKDT